MSENPLAMHALGEFGVFMEILIIVAVTISIVSTAVLAPRIFHVLSSRSSGPSESQLRKRAKRQAEWRTRIDAMNIDELAQWCVDNPADLDALKELRQRTETGDPAPYCRALRAVLETRPPKDPATCARLCHQLSDLSLNPPGDPDQACWALERLIVLFPKSAEARSTIDGLARLRKRFRPPEEPAATD